MDYVEALKPNSILKPKWLSSPDVTTFIKILAEAGIDLVFSGGAVRDAIIDIHARPKDFDVFANANADILQKTLAASGVRAEITSTGKVIAYINDAIFDIFNLPPVDCKDTSQWLSPESLRDKVLNFEFNINTLVLRPTGILYDFFGAIGDIHEKHVRFIIDPMQSIPRNTLSRVMLRYIRFCVQFGESRVDDYALEACNFYKKNLAHPTQKPLLTKDFFSLLSAPYAADVLPALQQHDMFFDVCGIKDVSLSPLATLMELENNADPSEKLMRRVVALLLGKLGSGGALEGLTELAQHLDLPDEKQKNCAHC